MEVICILCPKGCLINVSHGDESLNILGNACVKGLDFARQEWTHPMRTLSTTIRTTSNRVPRVPVKTSATISKDDLLKVMAYLSHVQVTLPVKMGDCIVKNVLELNVDVVATCSMEEL